MSVLSVAPNSGGSLECPRADLAAPPRALIPTTAPQLQSCLYGTGFAGCLFNATGQLMVSNNPKRCPGKGRQFCKNLLIIVPNLSMSTRPQLQLRNLDAMLFWEQGDILQVVSAQLVFAVRYGQRRRAIFATRVWYYKLVAGPRKMATSKVVKLITTESSVSARMVKNPSVILNQNFTTARHSASQTK